MEELLSLEVLILIILMNFIENRDVNKDEKENKDKAVVVAVLPPISLLSQPFLSLSPKLFSPLLLLTFLFISLFLFHIVACSSFPLIFPDLFSPILSFISSLLSLFLFPLLASSLLSHLAYLTSLFLSSLARLFVPLFTFPLSALPVPRVQELTLASLTRPLLGALRQLLALNIALLALLRSS